MKSRKKVVVRLLVEIKDDYTMITQFRTYGGIVLLLIASAGCNSSKKTSQSSKLEDGGVITASIEAKQQFSLMIDKPEGLVSYEGRKGKISIGSKVGSDPNVMCEPAEGNYSLIIDQNGDGFPETGVERISKKRVKFLVSEVPAK